jgi:hypothetical protein
MSICDIRTIDISEISTGNYIALDMVQYVNNFRTPRPVNPPGVTLDTVAS